MTKITNLAISLILIVPGLAAQDDNAKLCEEIRERLNANPEA